MPVINTSDHELAYLELTCYKAFLINFVTVFMSVIVYRQYNYHTLNQIECLRMIFHYSCRLFINNKSVNNY